MSKRARRQLRFRGGEINAAGGRPINPYTRTIKTVCAANFLCSATTAGDVMGFEVAQFGTPCSPTYNVTFSEQGTLLNHPSEHPEIVAGGWKEARVLSSMYRFDLRNVNLVGSEPWIFAYKFGISAAAPMVFTAGDITIDNWKDMRQSRGWVWKRMSGSTGGGSVYPSEGRIEVKVPSVWRLYAKLLDTEIDEEGLQMLVQDAADNPTLRAWLHVLVMSIDGGALAAGDISMDVTIYQNVLLTRSTQTAEMIDEADQVGA